MLKMKRLSRFMSPFLVALMLFSMFPVFANAGTDDSLVNSLVDEQSLATEIENGYIFELAAPTDSSDVQNIEVSAIEEGISQATEVSKLNDRNSDDMKIVVDGNKIKLDLTKQPAMTNSKTFTINPEKVYNDQLEGYSFDFEFFLAPDEQRKDMRVIEYDMEKNELTIETGVFEGESLAMLESVLGFKEPTTTTAASNYGALLRGWSWDPPGIILNKYEIYLNWSSNNGAIGTYNAYPDYYAYNGITKWYADNKSFSKSANTSWCQANGSVRFWNQDWLTPSYTYVTYSNATISGYPNGSFGGSVKISIAGECAWMLLCNYYVMRN